MTVAGAKEIVCQAIEEPLFERGVSDSRIRRHVLARAALDFLLAELTRKDEALRRIADDAASYCPGRIPCERSSLLAAFERIAGDAEAALGKQP